ncbi:AAA family ATPase [Neolewinella persica]|uniref:AAA family ATPase n=1 Tax=Neolewinella persica TaxID=70998 RepID=UPI0003729577|nr:ATP-binding protein [Neolewinella persica]
MLLSFSVANFKSFREEQVLDLTASALQPAFSWLENAIVPVGKGDNALRVKALYGANASGKSNLIKALYAMLSISLLSAKTPGMLPSNVHPYAFAAGNSAEPSSFELVFVADSKRYRYGFSATQQAIVKEWLYDETVRKAKVFERVGQSASIGRKYFDNPESVDILERGDNELFREDASFLSALALFNVGKVVKDVTSFLSGITIFGDVEKISVEQNAYKLLAHEGVRDKVLELLRFAGIEFKELFVVDKKTLEGQGIPPVHLKELQSTKGRLSLVVSHKWGDAENEISGWLVEKSESQGTQKLLVMAPYIVQTILQGRILIIDEFEAKLHTRLSREIVSMFNSSTGNPNNAQFIFSTHDTNLLDHRLLRRDQIDFVEKGKDRASIIYSLADIKGIRKDSDFELDYLGGSYGAVPDVTDFNIAILED